MTVMTFLAIAVLCIAAAIALSLYLDNRAKRAQAERELRASKPYQRQWRDAPVRSTARPLRDTSSDRSPAEYVSGADQSGAYWMATAPIDTAPACHDNSSSASSCDSGSASSDSSCSSSD